MAGTKAGGMKAAQTNKAKHGSDFYAKIGAKGGKLGKTGGFAANPELARIAGRKGGLISRRGKKVTTTVAAGSTQKTA
jgi:general stress protein YciG